MTAEASEDPASGQAGQTGQAARTAQAAAEDSAAKDSATEHSATEVSAATGPAGAQAPAGAAAPGGKPTVAELPGLLLRKSRRFPLITRDTARPQGGGRAAPGSAPATARQWPFLAVVGGVALGLLIVSLDGFRLGTALIGLSLLAGAALRWALPEVGMLAVRSRFTDLLTYGGLGAVILLLSLMVQPDPWIKLPFLQDVVHFTVR
ncbi:DUF3017 domain-containing protein [Streptomyces botrytidirepellens]|uniref:DUF3017 domain-containing protein n=1 Tax=Streptomyces botrytidirepellens TaxID=2486417 RepID=UPI001FED180D|nr:DUF3017 domain-containing protein [Streptomyces botrytidirepellens]